MTGDLTTIPCPNCSEQISAKAVACKHCGQVFVQIDNSTQQTLVIERPRNALSFEDDERFGRTGSFKSGSIIYLSIERVNTPIARHVSEKPLVLGRADTTTLQNNHDIDLNPYNALDRGVSRHHAKIYASKGTLYIEDLGSSNGTTLNGEALAANQPEELHDGDELMLGRMLLWINFD